MKRTLIALLITALPCLSNVAQAGSERESYTYDRGFDLFFSWLPNRWEQRSAVGFEATEKLRKIHSHCRMGKPIFDLLSVSKNKCAISISRTEKGEEYWDMAMIEIIGKQQDTEDSSLFGLFSTSAPHKSKWQQRPLEEEERSSILEILSANHKPSGPNSVSLDLKSAWVVFLPAGRVRTYFVPGSHIKDDEAYYEATRHHVFTSSGGLFRYQGRIPDKPIHYVNSGSDVSPLVITSESCDGMCVKLWSVSSGPKVIATFGGH